LLEALAAEDAVGATIEVGRRAGRVGDLGVALHCRAGLETAVVEELPAGTRGLRAEDALAVRGTMEVLLGFLVGALVGSVVVVLGGTLGFVVTTAEWDGLLGVVGVLGSLAGGFVD
jgi:hypothetical protein